jgi:hypothetical protein
MIVLPSNGLKEIITLLSINEDKTSRSKRQDLFLLKLTQSNLASSVLTVNGFWNMEIRQAKKI